MKAFRTSLLWGFAVDVACAVLGYAGAVCCDFIGRIAEAIYSPSFYLAGLLFHFNQSGRSTIFRDVAIVFITQWFVCSLMIFAMLQSPAILGKIRSH